MKYSQKELFDFMESGREVTVLSTNGKIYSGRCWAYSAGLNLEEFSVDEPSLEVCDTLLYLSDIVRIEFKDQKDCSPWKECHTNKMEEPVII